MSNTCTRFFRTTSVLLLLSLSGAHLAAQTPAPLPENTIDCKAFQKLPDGNWYVGPPTTFDIGNVKRATMADQRIAPRFLNMGGADLYDVLERKCGG